MNTFTPSETAARQLLAQAGLPTADIDSERLTHFFGCGNGSALDGIVGLELYSDVALLRSLAVSPPRRKHGLGSLLVAHAERHAQAQGVRALYLLTTTAEKFFLRIGYAPASRAQAPVTIRGTAEFSNLCPASAVFMVKHLPIDPSNGENA